jgi:threonine aldolase
MSLREELETIDATQLLSSTSAMFAKAESMQETNNMLDATYAELPVFKALDNQLRELFESMFPADGVYYANIGAQAVLVALREYVQTEEMDRQFPQPPQA